MRRHRNPEQSKILIDFMQLHKDVAFGRVARQDRENNEILWKSLTESLNAHGPPIKDRNEWKKAWIDWKMSCQKKLTQPDDGSRSITDHEQIIIDIYGWTAKTIKEYESDENSTSSDTPLKLTTQASNQALQMDPLKQENQESQDVPQIESNHDCLNEPNRGRHRSSEQSKILLNFMLLHKDLAKRQHKERNNDEIRMLWQQLTNELNACGPPVKSVNAWKKVWADWKVTCRKKQESDGERRCFTKLEQSIIELCNLNALPQLDYDSGEDSESSSISSNSPLKTFNMPKKRKLNEENLSETYEEYVTMDYVLNSQEEPQEITAQASTSKSTKIEQTLTGLSAGVASIQTSLQELCKLIAEQNQEMKRFFADSRRHHFVMEKEMIEKKRKKMK